MVTLASENDLVAMHKLIQNYWNLPIVEIFVTFFRVCGYSCLVNSPSYSFLLNIPCIIIRNIVINRNTVRIPLENGMTIFSANISLFRVLIL